MARDEDIRKFPLQYRGRVQVYHRNSPVVVYSVGVDDQGTGHRLLAP